MDFDATGGTEMEMDAAPLDPGPVLIRIPPQIMKAVMAVQEAIVPLIREFWNEEAGFDYASIDQYYAQVSPIALRHGLRVMVDIIDTRVIIVEKIEVIEAMVSVTLEYKTGLTVKNYRQFPIHHPYEGPQGSGAMLSYAKKMAHRNIFDIVTGESDADSMAPTRRRNSYRAVRSNPAGTVPAHVASQWAGKPGPRSEPAPICHEAIEQVFADANARNALSTRNTVKRETNAELFERIATETKECRTAEALDFLWHRNKSAIERSKIDEPQYYDAIVKTMGEMRRKLGGPVRHRKDAADGSTRPPRDGHGEPQGAPERQSEPAVQDRPVQAQEAAQRPPERPRPALVPDREAVPRHSATVTVLHPVATTKTSAGKPPPAPWLKGRQPVRRPNLTAGFPRQPKPPGSRSA